MKNVFYISLLSFFSIVAFFTEACKDESNPLSDINKIVFPDSLVSYTEHVQPLFNIACATADCHDGTSNGHIPNLTYYEGMRYGPPSGLIEPGKPELSILVITIEQDHDFYPLPLNANHIKGIKRWITEGAKKN